MANKTATLMSILAALRLAMSWFFIFDMAAELPLAIVYVYDGGGGLSMLALTAAVADAALFFISMIMSAEVGVPAAEPDAAVVAPTNIPLPPFFGNIYVDPLSRLCWLLLLFSFFDDDDDEPFPFAAAAADEIALIAFALLVEALLGAAVTTTAGHSSHVMLLSIFHNTLTTRVYV